MAWSKQSADVGLGGLTPEEAARGALFLPDFQKMPDPLGDKKLGGEGEASTEPIADEHGRLFVSIFYYHKPYFST